MHFIYFHRVKLLLIFNLAILDMGRLSVIPFSLCTAFCYYKHSVGEEIFWHNSRGMEQRLPILKIKVRGMFYLVNRLVYQNSEVFLSAFLRIC